MCELNALRVGRPCRRRSTCAARSGRCAGRRACTRGPSPAAVSSACRDHSAGSPGQSCRPLVKRCEEGRARRAPSCIDAGVWGDATTPSRAPARNCWSTMARLSAATLPLISPQRSPSNGRARQPLLLGDEGREQDERRAAARMVSRWISSAGPDRLVAAQTENLRALHDLAHRIA